MHKLICIIALALAPLAVAVDYEFLGGNTSKFVMVNMYALDGTPKTGLLYSDMTITYTRNNGSADVDVTEVTMTMGTWTSGGWIQVDSTNSPGLYQFAIPDAAIATGAESVTFSFKATSTFQRFIQASIIAVDLRGSAYVPANTVQIEGSDATNQINTEADTALADYDAPTNAEMVARTLTSASYATATALSTAQSDLTAILADTNAMDTSGELQTLLFGSATPGATASALTTAQSDITAILADTSTLDTQAELQALLFGSATAGATASALSTAQTSINGLVTGVTLATSQPNYAPATASALSTAQSDITAILADTAAMDTSSELRTLLTGSNTALATGTAQSTAQSDLDTLTGADGATLATLQPNYAPNTTAPPTVGAIRTELETAGGNLALILEDTGTTLPSTLSGLATGAALTTAQSDLDAITGSDGVTLATSQPNYAPYAGTPPTVGQIRTELEGAGTKLTLALADTDELQTRLANMIEADGLDWRFTTNALEQGPTGGGGGGGDATAANQLLIIDHLEGIEGATFDTATDSLEAIRNHGDAAWGSGGGGHVPINQDTGGADTFTVKDGSGAGIENALVMAYVKAEYDAGTFTLRGQTTTKADGTWNANLMLNDGIEYTLVFYKPGAFGPSTATVTPEE